MSKKIKTISFLVGDQRVYVHATKFGRFKIPVIKESDNGHKRMVNKMMSPRQVVEDSQVRTGDPTLTLENGQKIRVYQGGDPSNMITEAQSILDLHEEKTRKTNQSWIKKPAPVNKSRTTLSADYDIFQDIMNWDYGDAD